MFIIAVLQHGLQDMQDVQLEVVMAYMDKVIGLAALTLAALALAGVLSTDAYSHGAQVQASGDNALAHLIGFNTLCLNDRPAASAAFADNQVTNQ